MWGLGMSYECMDGISYGSHNNYLYILLSHIAREC